MMNTPATSDANVKANEMPMPMDKMVGQLAADDKEGGMQRRVSNVPLLSGEHTIEEEE